MTGVALVASLVSTAQAQGTTVAVTTTGCFRSASDSRCVFGQTATNNTFLSFTGGPQNAVSASSTGNTQVDLGTVHVGSIFGFSAEGNQPFTLKTTFTSPAGASPNGQLFESFTNGVLFFNSGHYRLDFSNNSASLVNFDGGSLMFNVNDPNDLTSTGDFQLQGTISNVTTTLEPSSVALLGSGLVGLVPLVRRGRK